MNKRKVLSLILISILAVSILAGCTKDKEKTPAINEETQTEQTEQTEDKNVDETENNKNVTFEIIEKFDEEALKMIDEKTKEKGYGILSRDDNSVVIFIASGEKPSGGYGIKAKTVEEKDGVITITVEETAPEEGAMVITALTYPYTVIRLDTKATEFVIVNTEGEEFTNLDKKVESSYELKEAEGVYIGAIDNNSVEILLDGEEKPMAFRLEELDNFESPKENAKVKISYYTNEYSQNMLKSLEVLK
jgi:hypothetical protein